MNISKDGVEFIQKMEGCVLHAYKDTGGVLTIGTGHTGEDVQEGLVITQEQADELLQKDLAWVEETIQESVTVPLNQNQYDAICSLIFNIGKRAFKKSTLLRVLNQKEYKDAADQFLKWKFDNGKVNTVLFNRRKAERAIFLKQI